MGNLILSLYLGIGLGGYVWVMHYWFTTRSARSTYPAAPVVLLVLTPLWPLIFWLLYSDEEEL